MNIIYLINPDYQNSKDYFHFSKNLIFYISYHFIKNNALTNIYAILKLIYIFFFTLKHHFKNLLLLNNDILFP